MKKAISLSQYPEEMKGQVREYHAHEPGVTKRLFKKYEPKIDHMEIQGLTNKQEQKNIA